MCVLFCCDSGAVAVTSTSSATAPQTLTGAAPDYRAAFDRSSGVGGVGGGGYSAAAQQSDSVKASIFQSVLLQYIGSMCLLLLDWC